MTKRLTAYLTNSLELVSRYDIEEDWMCRKITNSEFELFATAIQDNENLWGELSGTLFDTCKVVEEQKKQRDLKRRGGHGK